jgi:preprotein translocase subunit SecD
MSKQLALRLYLLSLAIVGVVALIDLPAQFSVGKLPFVRPQLLTTFFSSSFGHDLELKQGLDIQGGTSVTLAVDMSQIASGDRTTALESARSIVERRINLYGVSEATVQSLHVGEAFRIVAQIPGVKDTDAAVNLIGSTAQLDFREYKPATRSAALASVSGMLVQDFVPSGLTGKDLQRASVTFDANSGKPQVSLQFTPDGTKKFADITTRSIGKPLAIFLDSYPITTPVVQTAITDGQAQISGTFTPDSAKQLAVALNAGALPVPITVIEQRTVGATLGADAVARSIRAGLIGVGLIMIFLILMYGWKGALASISLVVYGILSLALYKLIPVTLSLAGIAGFLLSVGMAVDTNILVFERLREEERSTVETSRAIARAFQRAWNSIKDANVVTLLTAFILYNPLDWSFLNSFGTVRGFALTLSLGIVLNLVCGMGLTRVLMVLFYDGRKEEKL